MTDIDQGELREALDVLAIQRLQARYGDVVTRRAWGELDDLFVTAAPIELDLRRGEPLHLVGAAALGEMVLVTPDGPQCLLHHPRACQSWD